MTLKAGINLNGLYDRNRHAVALHAASLVGGSEATHVVHDVIGGGMATSRDRPWWPLTADRVHL